MLLTGIIHDLTKTPAHVMQVLAVLLCVVAFLLRNMASETTNRGKKEMLMLMGGGALIAVAALEIFSYITNRSDPTWILSSFGDFIFGVVVWIVSWGIMYVQYNLTLGVLSDLMARGRFDSLFRLGLPVMVLCCLVALVGLFFGPLQVVAIVGFIGFQIYVVATTFISVIKNKGNVGMALLALVLYLATMAGLFAQFMHFVLSGIFAFLAFFFVKDGVPAALNYKPSQTDDNGVDYKKSGCMGCYYYNESSGTCHKDHTYAAEKASRDSCYTSGLSV